jgi:nitrite reductase (cytochrome c-552)
MNDVARACQTCHNYTESEIVARVDIIQKRTKGQLDRAEVAVVDLIRAISAAKVAGATDEQLKKPRDLQRRAQWRADYINAENSMGFHAPPRHFESSASRSITPDRAKSRSPN